MGFDLRNHGFTNSVISSDLRDLSDNLPKWNTIPYTITKRRDPIKVEYLSLPLRDISGSIYLPVYEWGNKIDEGTYGKIYLCKRKNYYPIDASGSKLVFHGSSSETQIVIKVSPITLTPEELKMPPEIRKDIIIEETYAHIHEAAVLTLAYIAVNDSIPGAIPRVYEMFCRRASDDSLKSVCIAMEYIKGHTLLQFMRNTFKKEGSNDFIFLQLVKQLANILLILQRKLRMNHRDIKINNILLREGTNQLVLIDYGFACIANGIQEPNAEFSKIQAGSYFGSRSACFKHGRDMCQFLYSLHCYFPCSTYLSPKLQILVRKWLSVEYDNGIANLLNGLDEHGNPSSKPMDKIEYNEGIYIFLRRGEVDPEQCSPELILEDIRNYLAG
jgi:serine/threonine protein kinase